MTSDLPPRHVPYGPLPSQPHLPPSCLRILYHLLSTAEASFLTGPFRELYPPARRGEISLLGSAVALEVLALAAGLKQSVLLGWGDGREEEGDRRVAIEWVKRVWERGVVDALDPPSLRDKPRTAPRPELELLRRFVHGCTFVTLGPIEGRDTVWTGHCLMSYGRGSPGVRTLRNTRRERFSRDGSGDELVDGPPTQFDESLLAHILDYPLPLPTRPETSVPSGRNVMITYGLAFASNTQMGTQYLVPPITTLIPGSGTVLSIVESHFKSYATRFEPVFKRIGIVLALSIEGQWMYGPTLAPTKPEGLSTIQDGAVSSLAEWDVMSRMEYGDPKLLRAMGANVLENGARFDWLNESDKG